MLTSRPADFYYGFTGVKPELTGKTACAAYAETCKAFGAGEMKSGCSPHDVSSCISVSDSSTVVLTASASQNEKFVRAWCTAKVASGFNVSVTGQVGRDMHGILLIRHNRGDQDPRCMRLSDKWCFDEAPERPYSRIRA